MQLKITDIVGIGCAEINLNGLTVIQGDGRTGKSTIARLINSVVNSTVDIYTKFLRDETKYALQEITRASNCLRGREVNKDFAMKAGEILKDRTAVYSHLFLERYLAELISLIKKAEGNSQSEKTALSYLGTAYENFKRNELELFKAFQDRLIKRRMRDKFEDQVRSLKTGNNSHFALLHDASSPIFDIKLSDEEESWFYKWSGTPFSDVVVFDNHSITEAFTASWDDYDFCDMRDYLQHKTTNLYEDIVIASKIKRTMEVFDLVVPYDINDVIGELMTTDDRHLKPCNLSESEKLFSLIKFFVKNGVINDSTLLVFDSIDGNLSKSDREIFEQVILRLRQEIKCTVLVLTSNTHNKQLASAPDLDYYVASRDEKGAIEIKSTVP